MEVITEWNISVSPDKVWPLLTGSRMQLPARSVWFKLGLPRPVECRLPSGDGAVGATRECVAAQGVVHQVITEWDAPHVLVFEMVDTKLVQQHFCQEVCERFELSEPAPGVTRIVRTTQVELRKGGRRLVAPFLYVGLKTIHRYVFRNWSASASRPSLPVVPAGVIGARQFGFTDPAATVVRAL